MSCSFIFYFQHIWELTEQNNKRESVCIVYVLVIVFVMLLEKKKKERARFDNLIKDILSYENESIIIKYR